MKATIYSLEGKKTNEIELPKLFDNKIREDLAIKLYEIEKSLAKQLYSPSPFAGKRHSASGIISHLRHDWKGHYGKGISRIPRKVMWRRGTQFFWIGAEVASTRGGRRAHPPKIIRKIRKINKKEVKMAINSALASTANEKYLSGRYSSLKDIKIKLPIVVETVPNKSKDIIAFLKIVLGQAFGVALKNKTVRAGKGKLRGRKYKSNQGVLIVTSKDEKVKMKGVDVVQANRVSILDVYPLGRLTIFTEKAIKELGGKKE